MFSLDGLRYAAALAAFTALGGGAAFMTTVGYGDISPQTDAGRLVAIGVMLVGIGFIAVLTAALAERFVAKEVEEEVEEAEISVRRELREIAQRLQDLERRLP